MGLAPKCRGQFSGESEKGYGMIGGPKRVNLGVMGEPILLQEVDNVDS